MENRQHVFLISYAIAALLILIGLNIYAYRIRHTFISEDNTLLLKAVSHYKQYFLSDIIPNLELKHCNAPPFLKDGIKNSQKMKSTFFDCVYVMPPLKKGGHCNVLGSNQTVFSVPGVCPISISQHIANFLRSETKDFISVKTKSISNLRNILWESSSIFITAL